MNNTELDSTVFNCSIMAELPLDSTRLCEKDWWSLGYPSEMSGTSVESSVIASTTNNNSPNQNNNKRSAKVGPGRHRDVSRVAQAGEPGGPGDTASPLKRPRAVSDSDEEEEGRNDPSSQSIPEWDVSPTAEGLKLARQEEKAYQLAKSKKLRKRRKTNKTTHSENKTQTNPVNTDINSQAIQEIPPKPTQNQESSVKKQSETQNQNKKSARKRLFHEKITPTPDFLEFPVIIEDLREGPATLHGLGLHLFKTLSVAVGTILSVRKLPGGRVLVGCVSPAQQQKLIARSKIGGITINCFAPEATTEGVIKRVPLSHSDGELMEMNVSVRVRSDTGGIIEKGKNTVKNMTRLKTKDQKPSTAVRIVFKAAVLPECIVLEGEIYGVEPYSMPARRCGKCQRLGHLKFQCRSKKPTCARCGTLGHEGKDCVRDRHCINCQGEHSSAYQGCPEIRLRVEANRIRASSYIPYAEALLRARKQKEQKLVKQQGPTLPSEKRDDYWRAPVTRASTPREGYAFAAKRGQAIDHAPLLESIGGEAAIPPFSQRPRPRPKPRTLKPNIKQKHPKDTHTQTEQYTNTEPTQTLPYTETQKDDLTTQILTRVMKEVEEGILSKIQAERRKAEEELAQTLIQKIYTTKKHVPQEQSELQAFLEQTLIFMMQAKQQQNPNALIDSLTTIYNSITKLNITPIKPDDTMLALGSLAGARDLTIKEILQYKMTL